MSTEKKTPVQANWLGQGGCYSGLQVEDEMLQCSVCEDWFHSRVSMSVNWSQIFPLFFFVSLTVSSLVAFGWSVTHLLFRDGM